LVGQLPLGTLHYSAVVPLFLARIGLACDSTGTVPWPAARMLPSSQARTASPCGCILSDCR
jgi:hypothetical protein